MSDLRDRLLVGRMVQAVKQRLDEELGARFPARIPASRSLAALFPDDVLEQLALAAVSTMISTVSDEEDEHEDSAR